MRLPVAVSLQNRGDTTAKDARMVNAFAEVTGDPANGGVARAVKRPGLDSSYTVTAGTGQGIFTRTTPGTDGDDETLVVITEDTINTSPAPITKAMLFVQQPTNPDGIGEVMSPAVTVRAVDKSGNTVTGFTGTVNLSLASNPTGATLGGDTSNAAVSGIATFNDLELDRSGSGFTITASSTPLNSAVSTAFSLPTSLVFTVQPVDGQPEVTLDPIEVTAQDDDGNTDTHFIGSVTLSLHSASGGGELSGTLTETAVAGVASFTNVEISESGTYTLKASCDASGNNLATSYKPAPVISDSFTVAFYTLTAADLGMTPFGYGYSNGAFIYPAGGALSPNTFEGNTINALLTFGVVDSPLVFTVLQIAGTLSQDIFTTITIGGVPLLSADAAFFQAGGATFWTWIVNVVSPGTYEVTIA